jgi:signal transduction histidine kinase
MMHLGLWLGQTEDARLFRTLLELHDIASLERPDLRPGDQRAPLDLAVMDLRSHIDLADQLHACRTAEAPRFLPVLLLVHPSDLYPASRHLGCTADEVVLTPTRRIELCTRVHSLLQGMRMSLELESLHRSRAEQALEEVRSLRHLEALRDQFIGSVSHELRTPQTTIMGFAELLADGLAGPLGTEARDFVLEIKRAGQRITHLVDELLNDARLQAGTPRFIQSPSTPWRTCAPWPAA